MQKQLEIAIIQSDLIWENPKRNRNHFEEKINKLKNSIDLIILPEMFTTGFTMNANRVAEKMNGETIIWMKQKSSQIDSVIMGSIIISEKNYFYNRFIAAFPDGSIKYFDKRHLFSFAGEGSVYKSGDKMLIFSYKGFKIFPLICYDLRFPVWSRNTNDVDILIYIANWPNTRISAWDTLLKARAIENMCYSIGVNRVGEDNNLVYNGHSCVNNCFGKTILSFENSEENIKTIILKKNELDEVRKKFRFLNDKDSFTIQY